MQFLLAHVILDRNKQHLQKIGIFYLGQNISDVGWGDPCPVTFNEYWEMFQSDKILVRIYVL